MALVLMDGFEFAPAIRSNISGFVVATAQTGRDGVGRGVSFTTAASVALAAPVSTIIIGIGIWSSSVAAVTLVSLYGDANTTAHVVIGLNGSGQVTATRGVSGTLLATGSTVLAASAWHWIEIKATIADAGGICIVKVDGLTEINFTGDTKNAGTLTTFSTVRLNSGGPRFDDLVICDATGSAPFNDFFGEKVIKVKRPTGNGATNQWVGSDGNSTDNYLLVDDPPPVSSTDYTGSATATERDLYAMSAVTGLVSVDAIQNIAYVAKSDVGARSFKTVTRNADGAVTASPAVALTTTYTLMAGSIELADPSAAAWTTSNVNTIHAGVECV
jgi:hypothetical protein